MTSPLPAQVEALAHKFPIWPVTSDGACTCNQAGCTRPGKHARCSWGSFPGGWSPAPGENYGIRTGAINGIFVVDCDGLEAVRAFLDAVSDNETTTFSVRTGREDGGAHYYFKHPGGDFRVKTGKDVLGKGIDVRGDGGMVVGPGSFHRTGARYRVADDLPIVDAPAEVLELVRDIRERHEGDVESLAEDDPLRPARLAAFVDKCQTHPPDGSNNLFRLAQYGVRLYELDDETVYDQIQHLYNTRCTPEWSPAELDHKIADARRVGDVPVGVGEWFAALLHQAAIDQQPGALKAAEVKRELLADLAVRLPGYTPPIHNFAADDDTMIVRFLKETYAKENILFTEGNWWRYEPELGVWRDCGGRVHEDLMSLHACTYISPKGEVQNVKMSANRFKGMAQLLAVDCGKDNEKFFETATPGFSCKSGFVTVTTGGEVEVLEHSLAFRCRAYHDVDFDLDAPAPRLDAFLDSLFLHDEDAEQKKLLVAEYFGVSLFGCASQFQKALLFLGEGSNGKSAAMQLLQEMFPVEGSCSIHPKHFGDPPQLARLPGKVLNVVFELGKSRILEADTLKNVIVGDQISACEKYKAPFDFRPIAGNVFGLNALPATNDLSHGFFRRFLIVTFNRTFDATTADPHVLRDVREERAGILAWLVRGAARALAAEGFTTPTSHYAELGEWKRDGDPVALFLEQRTKAATGDGQVTANKLWDSYVEWCERFGFHAGTTTAFGRRLTALKVPRRRSSSGSAYGLALLAAKD